MAKALDTLVKVIVVGDSGVGKTNLLTYFCEGLFKDSYIATIGVDFKIKKLQVDDRKVKLQIWDTAGQERFRNITQTYYKGAEGIMIAYAINDEKSFRNVESWLRQIESHAQSHVPKVLLGTKADLHSERHVAHDRAQQLAQQYGMTFFEVSAKQGQGVSEAFIHLAKQVRLSHEGVTPSKQKISLEQPKPKATLTKCLCPQ